MYLQRVTHIPQLGKERELQRHLEAYVQAAQGRGVPLDLAVQVFNPEGPAFVLTLRLADLAALDQLRRGHRASQAFHDAQAATAALSRRPPRVELLEVLVPLPDGR